MGMPKIWPPQNRNPWPHWDKIWLSWLRCWEDRPVPYLMQSRPPGVFSANGWNICENLFVHRWGLWCGKRQRWSSSTEWQRSTRPRCDDLNRVTPSTQPMLSSRLIDWLAGWLIKLWRRQQGGAEGLTPNLIFWGKIAVIVAARSGYNAQNLISSGAFLNPSGKRGPLIHISGCATVIETKTYYTHGRSQYEAKSGCLFKMSSYVFWHHYLSVNPAPRCSTWTLYELKPGYTFDCMKHDDKKRLGLCKK